MNFILSSLSVAPPIPAIGPLLPVVLSISPPTGDVAGGTAVTISGLNFVGIPTVTISGVSASSVVVVNSTTITALTGAGTFALVGVLGNVVVTTRHGVGTGTGLFTYTAWYLNFQIGGVYPNFIVDFTTEGTTNHYFFNNATYGSAAAWLAAISGTFSRAGTAFFTNSSGTLTSAANNVLRFDYDAVALTSKGILLEGASTNLQLNSQTFSSFTTENSSTSVNAITAPDGTVTGTQLVENNAASSHDLFQQIGSTISGGVFSASVYAKAGLRSFIAVNGIDGGGNRFATLFNLSNGTVAGTNTTGSPTGTSNSITPAGNGWYRCSITMNTSNAAAPFLQIGLSNSGTPTWGGNNVPTYTGDGASYAYIWGAQLEALSFTSSYIATTGSTASRVADSLTTTPISAWYNATNGVTYAKGDTFGPGNGIPDSIAITDAPGNNFIDLRLSNSSSMALVFTGGVTQFHPQVSDSGQVPTVAGVSTSIAVSASAGGFIFVRDAGTPDNGGAGSMPVSPTTMGIGSHPAFPAQILYGHIRQVGYWPITATAAQLQALT